MIINGYARLDPDNPLDRACTHPWEYYYEPFQIYGNLYYVGNRRVSAHLIDTGDGLLLFDTAFAGTVYLLIDAVVRLGFNPKDIRHIFHTHMHYDHMQGTKAISELYGSKTYIGANEESFLTDRADLNMAHEGSLGYFEAFEPDVLMKDGDIITIGNTTIEVVETPGHSLGTLSFFFNVEAEGKSLRAALPGCIGMSPLKTKLLEKSGLPLSLREDYKASLEKIRSQKVDIILGAHPHHIDMFPKREALKNGKENPFINSDWNGFIDGQLAAFDKFLEEENHKG